MLIHIPAATLYCTSDMFGLNVYRICLLYVTSYTN